MYKRQANATVTESMLVALEHMQVSYVTVRKTGLERFKKNTISFPQDIARFAVRMEMLGPEEYRKDDRVNSRRGPGRELGRPERKKDDPSVEGRERFGVDEYGCLVFPATVKRVESDGRLVLEYDHCKGEEFVEWAHDVNPRVQMPWHPKNCLLYTSPSPRDTG